MTALHSRFGLKHLPRMNSSRSQPMLRPTPKRASILNYAMFSLAAFLLGAGPLSLMIWKPESITALGLTDRLFYLILIPVGLGTACFLFGVLQSYAVYSGHALGGGIELRSEERRVGEESR